MKEEPETQISLLNCWSFQNCVQQSWISRNNGCISFIYHSGAKGLKSCKRCFLGGVVTWWWCWHCFVLVIPGRSEEHWSFQSHRDRLLPLSEATLNRSQHNKKKNCWPLPLFHQIPTIHACKVSFVVILHRLYRNNFIFNTFILFSVYISDQINCQSHTMFKSVFYCPLVENVHHSSECTILISFVFLWNLLQMYFLPL